LESKAGVQCNLAIRDVNGYTRVSPFSNKYLPIFWMQLVSVFSLVIFLNQAKCVEVIKLAFNRVIKIHGFLIDQFGHLVCIVVSHLVGE
jgi:hypothetical protein